MPYCSGAPALPPSYLASGLTLTIGIWSLTYMRLLWSPPLCPLRDSVGLPLRRLGPFSFLCLLRMVASSSSPQEFPLSYRAQLVSQLGRLGGSRWGWVLQTKHPCLQTNVLSLSYRTTLSLSSLCCILSHPSLFHAIIVINIIITVLKTSPLSLRGTNQRSLSPYCCKHIVSDGKRVHIPPRFCCFAVFYYKPTFSLKSPASV